MGRDEFIDWRVKGKCTKLDPSSYDSLFFPGSGRTSNKAKEFCNNCPVIAECLQAALDNNDDGIRAGTSFKERQLMQRWRNPVNVGGVTRINLTIS